MMTFTYRFYLLVLPTLTGLSALGQEPTSTVPFTKVLTDGGWPMGVLGLLSLFGTFMVIYFFFTLRLNVLMPKAFRQAAESIAEIRDVEALYQACRDDKSSGASIIGSAARLMMENPNAEYIAVRDVIEDEGSRQSNALWQKIQYLMDIAVAAPMVGLLGTVLGMIQAFVGLQEDFGTVKPIALASGVSQALVTTAGGLIIGIAAMLFYSYFRGHVNRLVTRLEEECNTILHRFIFNRKSAAE